MSGALKEIWEKVDQMIGPQRMETEAEHIARDMREGRFPERSDPIQVPVAGTEATAIARMGAGDGLVERISEPHDPGDFVGDIFYGHPIKTTMGTHRWTGTEWVALPSEAEALAGLLAEARKEAAAHIAALTAQNRELALDVLASSGQAQEAYTAQIAAVAERDALRAKVARLEGALQWCSGSQDFQVEGFAREGWVKLCAPLLDAAITEAGHE